MNKPDNMIFDDSPEAASIQTVTGWVSRDGHFFGANEDAARLCGATHHRCKACGEAYEIRSYCAPCSERKAAEKYAAMPKVPYNGDAVAIHNTDTFFWSEDELRDHCRDSGADPAMLTLVFAEPKYADQIDPNDHYMDDLPEGSEVPAAIAEAFEKLNEAIKACKEPLCWYAGRHAVDPASLQGMADELKAEAEE